MAQAFRRGGKGFAATVLALALGVALPPAAAARDREASLQPEQVRMVQRALNDLAYPVPLSGTWDDRTQAAVQQFQSANGLASTGALDDATVRALGVDPSAVQLVAGRRAAADRPGARGPLRDDPAVNCEINTTVDCLPGQ